MQGDWVAKIYNTRPMLKIKAKWSKKDKTNNTPTSFVVCTIDHKIWTSGGYKEASKLNIGDIIQVETSAERSQKYKITTVGREVVSKTMIEKNKSIIRLFKSKKFLGIRGGNGKGITIPQKILFERLGNDWKTEYVVKTKEIGGRKNGYPYGYKIDIANEELKLAIEVDGSSHAGRKKQDEKKTTALNLLGWKVFRVSNKDIIKNLNKIIDDINLLINDVDCPIDANIISIEKINTGEYFVYDITVEDCHNFYANGILVHNCQDLNLSQIKIALKLCSSAGRIIAVGDENQAIYGFRGASTNAIQEINNILHATQLPLSISYRCPTSHIIMAQRYVPAIEAAPNAIPGVIKNITGEEFSDIIKPGDMCICRNNAPLVDYAFDALDRGYKINIRGQDIGFGLQAIIKRLNAKNIPDLYIKLDKWRETEVSRLVAEMKNPERIDDKYRAIRSLSNHVDTISELLKYIKDLFSDENKEIIFSSIHKAKGLEADRVFILKFGLIPSKWARLDWEKQQEKNLGYIAITRSKDSLYFVD